jgi:hypothetical protein
MVDFNDDEITQRGEDAMGRFEDRDQDAGRADTGDEESMRDSDMGHDEDDSMNE